MGFTSENKFAAHVRELCVQLFRVYIYNYSDMDSTNIGCLTQ